MQSSNKSPLADGGKIFLIGFMGSGKSYWGSIWAKEKNLDFIDLDKLIEAQEQKTIAEIFEINGEDHFRKAEANMLRLLEDKENCIIACGGGTPCFNENIDWMNKNGITIYLQISPSNILQRVVKEKNKRPLINKLNEAELLFFIEQKLQEREPFYSAAKIIVKEKDISINTFSALNIV